MTMEYYEPLRILRVLADFHEVYDDNRVTTLFDQQEVVLVEDGMWIELYDLDGVSCKALIDSHTPRTIDCLIDWSTWPKQQPIEDFLTINRMVQDTIPSSQGV